MRTRLAQRLEGDVLSPYDLRILQFLATGSRDVEIADRMSISRSAVHYHFVQIRNILGVKTNCEAVAVATRLGMV